MPKQTILTSPVWLRTLFIVVAFLCVLFAGIVWPLMEAPEKASAATSTTVNFQARLQTASGGLVPDGFYNVEFKLYSASSGGTALWTETRTGGNTVRVVNGYLTANLGSVTAFGSSINWDQELWLTMNIGGTGTPDWDGEMSPRLKLTSVPYAFRAGRLASLAGSNTGILEFASSFGQNSTITLPDPGAATANVCYQGSASCGFLTGASTDFIQNQNSSDQTANFRISGTGRANTALQAPLFDAVTSAALNIGTTNATAINLNQNTTIAAAKTLTVTSGATSLTGASSGDALTVSNSTSTGNIAVFKDNSTDVLVIEDGGNVGIGVSNPERRLDLQVNNSTTNAPPFRILQEGSGDTSFELQDTNGKSFFVGMDASDGGSFKIASSASAAGTVTQPDPLFGLGSCCQSFTENKVWMAKIANTVNGTLTSISLYIDGVDGSNPGGKVAIYADSSGAPTGTPLANSGTQTLSTGWNTFPISISVTSGTTYWVARNVEGSGTDQATGTSGGQGYREYNDDCCGGYPFSGSWPNLTSDTPDFTDADGYLPMYMSITPSGLVDSFEGTNLLTLSETGAVTFQNSSNSAAAFRVLSASDVAQFTVDTNNSRVHVGGDSAIFDDTGNSLYLGNGLTNVSPGGFTIQGTGSAATGVAGGALTIQGGNATVGNANGGNLTVRGGSGAGTGVQGLVVIDTPTFSTASTQNCTSTPCGITLASINSKGAVLITTNAAGYTVTMPDPTITTAGRIMYVTNIGSNDFTLSVNGGGTGNLIAMKPNTTATMVWNGSDWTAAGASSSTDLQSAYNNTLTSAGGAELVLNAPGGSADGLTIRNNATTPITGGILEVQTSIGTNIFSVNNNISELVANGGAENSTTFATNWTSLQGTGSGFNPTISRTTTSGQYTTGQAGVSVVTDTGSGTTTGNGVRNNLATNPATNTTYMISFTAKLSSGTFTDLRVDYTPTGAQTGTQCIASQTIVTGDWTRITCEITTPATAVTNPDILIYQVADSASARTFYIDNLSMTLADNSGGIPNNVQIGGGIYGGAPTLFTLDRSSAPPVANGNTTYLGSMYYDTLTGRIQCYESDGWGACGSAPDNIITLTPEYTGAVLNGSGIGTMTADFCANDTALQVNTGFCASGLSRQYYKWTSPQATQQTYSIYVSYKLPNTFKEFSSASTITLTALTDSTTNGTVDYQVFRSTGSAVTSCGSQTTVTTPSANTWYTVPFAGDETACGFVGGNYIIFKINVRAQSNASVYVENLDFTYLNQ